ncbi:MAG: DUF4388 domain-containing protein [Planctomycetota bacterium]
MSFYGDLKSIHLADLLQNFEAHGLTGTLSLSGSKGAAHVYLQRGRISMLAADNRPLLMTTLERQGILPTAVMRQARAKRRGTGKSLGEMLVQNRIVAEDELRASALTILTEDLCDLVATADGEFKFKEGKPPSRIFDPEERRFDFALPVGPLLLEAARRSDEWDRIRKEVPSDAVYFVRCHGVDPPTELEGEPLAVGLLEAADGTRNARELVEVFPRQRFAAYQVLAHLVRARCLRSIEVEDLIELANRFASEDPQRASELVRSGLEANPHHRKLLTLQAALSEQLGDPGAAAAALKLLAHLSRDGDDSASGRSALDQAKRLTPQDPSVWERSMALALTEGRRVDAVADGLELVRLYREPGLHSKAREVLDRLRADAPDDTDLCREHARTLVDCGEAREAVRSLHRVAKVLVGREEYRGARSCYEEILGIAPADEEARRSIELIESEAFVIRKVRRRQFVRRVAAGTVIAACGILTVLEVRARADYAHAEMQISERLLIEKQRYREAVYEYLEVVQRNPLSATSLLDVPRRVRDLESKADRHDRETTSRRPPTPGG